MKYVFGKNDVVVVVVKFFRHTEAVLRGFVVVVVVLVWLNSGSERRGLEQHPYEHTCSTSFKHGECIAVDRMKSSRK